MGFLKTILIILLVYYLFKILARWFAPVLLGYAVKRTEKHFQENFDQFFGGYGNGQKEEGEVSINKKPGRKPKTENKDIGEYIDFEEID